MVAITIFLIPTLIYANQRENKATNFNFLSRKDASLIFRQLQKKKKKKKKKTKGENI